MKKIISLVAVLLIAASTFAQADSTKTKVTGYLSVGVSLTNSTQSGTHSDFNTRSYPSLEGGVCYGSFCLGAIVGRGNFLNIFKKNDAIENYYYEAKATGCIPIGNITGSVIFGTGQFFNTMHCFIEYGAGITYNKGKFGYGVTYSNWDGGNYLTPSITVNF